MTTIFISPEDVRKTKMFRSLDTMMQNITLKRYNMMAIQHGVNVATNRGFEKWNAETQEIYRNRMIVKELLKV